MPQALDNSFSQGTVRLCWIGLVNMNIHVRLSKIRTWTLPVPTWLMFHDVSFLAFLLWLGFLLHSFSIQIEQRSTVAEVEAVYVVTVLHDVACHVASSKAWVSSICWWRKSIELGFQFVVEGVKSGVLPNRYVPWRRSFIVDERASSINRWNKYEIATLQKTHPMLKFWFLLGSVPVAMRLPSVCNRIFPVLCFCVLLVSVSKRRFWNFIGIVTELTPDQAVFLKMSYEARNLL